MSTRDLRESLSKLGLELGEQQESRAITVLRAILSASETPGRPHAFGEIYEKILSNSDNFDPSRAWVHRLLKSLLEDGLIRLESPEAHRNKYIADVNSIANGLEKLKEEEEQRLQNELQQIKEELVFYDLLDVGHIAEQLVEELTGQKQVLSSRFIRGVQELHRLVKNNIIDRASQGDVIRSNMSWLGSFAQEGDFRLQKYFEAARKGVEINWLIDKQIFQMTERIRSHLSQDSIFQVFQMFSKLSEQNIPLDLRINTGPEAYNHISRNRDALVMIITEEPLTATYVTREFNADLIDNTVANFDELWDEAISILDLDAKTIVKLGIKLDGPIGKALISLGNS